MTFTLAQTLFYVFLAAHSIQLRAIVPALNRVLAASVDSVTWLNWHAPTVFLTMWFGGQVSQGSAALATSIGVATPTAGSTPYTPTSRLGRRNC